MSNNNNNVIVINVNGFSGKLYMPAGVAYLDSIEKAGSKPRIKVEVRLRDADEDATTEALIEAIGAAFTAYRAEVAKAAPKPDPKAESKEDPAAALAAALGINPQQLAALAAMLKGEAKAVDPRAAAAKAALAHYRADDWTSAVATARENGLPFESRGRTRAKVAAEWAALAGE